MLRVQSFIRPKACICPTKFSFFQFPSILRSWVENLTLYRLWEIFGFTDVHEDKDKASYRYCAVYQVNRFWPQILEDIVEQRFLEQEQNVANENSCSKGKVSCDAYDVDQGCCRICAVIDKAVHYDDGEDLHRRAKVNSDSKYEVSNHNKELADQEESSMAKNTHSKQ